MGEGDRAAIAVDDGYSGHVVPVKGKGESGSVWSPVRFARHLGRSLGYGRDAEAVGKHRADLPTPRAFPLFTAYVSSANPTSSTAAHAPSRRVCPAPTTQVRSPSLGYSPDDARFPHPRLCDRAAEYHRVARQRRDFHHPATTPGRCRAPDVW